MMMIYHRVIFQNVADLIATSEDPDQTAPILSSQILVYTVC